MLYLGIILSLLMLAYYYDYKGCIKYKNEFYYFTLFIFIIVGGLAYRLGIDTTRYIQYYDEIPNIFKIFKTDLSYNIYFDRWGKGFILLFSLCKTICSEYWFFQLIHAIIVNTIVFFFIRTNTKNIFLGILIYFLLQYFLFNFEVLREALSVCMLLIGWKYFLNNKWNKYYICSFLAISFLISGIITLIFPIFYLQIFRNIFRLGIPFIITCIILFASSLVISKIFFEYLSLIELADIDSYANTYGSSSLGESMNLGITGYTYYFLRTIFFPIFFFFIYLWNKKYNVFSFSPSYNKKMEYFLCWYVYITLISFGITIFSRFNNYVALFAIICIVDGVFINIKIFKKKLKLSFTLWMLILSPYLLILTYKYFQTDANGIYPKYYRYYPYESYFNPQMNKIREKSFLLMSN